MDIRTAYISHTLLKNKNILKSKFKKKNKLNLNQDDFKTILTNLRMAYEEKKFKSKSK